MKHDSSAAPTRVRPHKLWFQVDRFDGSTAWGPFAERFKFCAQENGWDEREKSAQLQSCLRGMAAQILCYGKKEAWTFAELFAKLEDRFGADDRSDEYLAKLETKRRGPKESLQQLCHSVEELVALAYPGPRTTHSDRFAIASFLRALDDVELAGKIRDKRPQTLDEAFKLAQMFDSFRTANAGGRFLEEDKKGNRDGHARAAAADRDDSQSAKGNNDRSAAVEQKMLAEIQALRNGMEALQRQKSSEIPPVNPTSATGMGLPMTSWPAPQPMAVSASGKPSPICRVPWVCR